MLKASSFQDQQKGAAPDPASPDDAARDPSGAETGNNRRFVSRFKLEALILVLLAASLVSIPFHDELLRKRFIVSPESVSDLRIRAYGDQPQGGASTIAADTKRPLSWSCNLSDKYEFFYCGYEIIFDRGQIGSGIDLSGYERVTLDLSYDGSAEWVRFYVKNFDPRYSDPKVEESVKFNKVEFLNRGGHQKITLRLSDFAVADWWLANFKIPPELSQPQFENIVAIDIQPGTGVKPGQHSFRVNSISFEGAMLTRAQWYLCLLAFWAVLILFFLAYRVADQRRQFELRHRLQQLESRQLQLAKSAAESASKAKSDFLASMSHELRTPLNAILGYAQLLGREQLSERQAAAARTIHQSGEHLLTLITDILDLSKIEAGKLELCPAPVDIRTPLQTVCDMMGIRAREKGLRFRCDIAADLPSWVIADDKRLSQILINLAGNAIKFTDAGAVTMTARAITQDDHAVRIRFEVEDSGQGIASSQLAQIFQPFEQAGGLGERAKGTGLGLSISRQLARLMNSDIEVESREGSGSKFWFDLDLPLAPAQQSPAAPSPTPQLDIGFGAGRTILIADDIEANRACLAHALHALGFKTIEVDNGMNAVRAAAQGGPELILMDLRMPEMDGYEATRQIRKSETRRTPIIAVSASVTTEVEQAALAAGADAFLAKPVDHDELGRMLSRYLAGSAGEATAPDEAAVDAPPLVPPPAEDLERLWKLAQAGNMRAIRTEAERIGALDARYRPFADRLQTLAGNFQSPAVLHLIETHLSRQAA